MVKGVVREVEGSTTRLQEPAMLQLVSLRLIVGWLDEGNNAARQKYLALVFLHSLVERRKSREQARSHKLCTTYTTATLPRAQLPQPSLDRQFPSSSSNHRLKYSCCLSDMYVFLELRHGTSSCSANASESGSPSQRWIQTSLLTNDQQLSAKYHGHIDFRHF